MMAEMLRAFDEQLEETAEQKQQRRAAQAGARTGSLGLANGRSPHVLDAMTLIKESFDELPSSSILRCWLRAD